MIYLDSAATSFQKPPEVYRAVENAMHTMASPGRGSYTAARNAEETAFRCRTAAAELFGAESAEQVVFTMNATHALNIAIRSVVPPGGKVIVSGWEHNAVTRTLFALGAEMIVAEAPLFDAPATLRAFEDRLCTCDADAVICTHVSNVFGFILPIGEIAELCRRHGVPLIVDASQSAGVLPVRLDELGAAFLAMPGHKGLYGPQGTGLLICGREATPLLYGGTGSESMRQEMPDFLPDRLEAGTHNMPGIAGLDAGIGFVRRIGTERMLRRERMLIRRAATALAKEEGITVYASPTPEAQAGVLSFCAEGREPEELAEALMRHGIALRAGLHCAPLAHRSAGTLPSGTLRVSVSAMNTPAEIDTFARILHFVLRERKKEK